MRISLIALLPASRGKNWLLRRGGHDVASSASIAPILLIGRTRMVVGEHAKIGPLNAFRNLRSLRLGPHAEIGQLNWVSAAPFLLRAGRTPLGGRLVVGDHGSVTSRHYIDVSGGVTVGRYSILAGVRSVLMTHGVDVTDGVLETAPITIGEYSMVGGSATMVLGAYVPPRSVVAMGAVVVKGLEAEGMLYAGVPAVAKRPIDIGVFGAPDRGQIRPRGA